jgi:hypothetical protein
VTGSCVGVPLTHVSIVQVLLSSCTSVSSTVLVMALVPLAPLHRLVWQLPAVCAVAGVPTVA